MNPNYPQGQYGDATRLTADAGASDELPRPVGVTSDDPSDLRRKRSLVKPERQRFDKGHRQFHYQQASQQPGVHVQPSTTGNEPILGRARPLNDQMPLPMPYQQAAPTGPYRGEYTGSGDLDTPNQSVADLQDADMPGRSGGGYGAAAPGDYDEFEPEQPTRTDLDNNDAKNEKLDDPADKGGGLFSLGKAPLSPWEWYCVILTFPIIPIMMRPFGLTTPQRQLAWREKIGLISVILAVAAIVGFLTFGFTQAVCDHNSTRIHYNDVLKSSLVISGDIYDLGTYDHPSVEGYSGAVLYQSLTIGGMDASYMFQNVNGHCTKFITPKEGTSIPYNSNNEMGWYFPCEIRSIDNSSLISNSDLAASGSSSDLYSGWACHTGTGSRIELYTGNYSHSSVYYSWSDLQSSTRQLIVFNGDVLDLTKLDDLLTDDLEVNPLITQLRNDNTVTGTDVSIHYSSGERRDAMQCLTQLTKVGTIDTETIGCIAADIVLYVSLVFIVGLVVVKFALACYFKFAIAGRQGFNKVSITELDEHDNNVEDWANDIYTPAPLPVPLEVPDGGSGGRNNGSRRKSFILDKLAPGGDEKQTKAERRITMTTQNPNMNTSRVVPGGSIFSQPVFRQNVHAKPQSSFQEFNDLSQHDLSYQGGVNRSFSPVASVPSPSGSQVGFSQMHPPTGPFTGSDSAISSPVPGSVNMSRVGPIGADSEYFVPQPPVGYQPFGFPLAHTMCLVTAYSESVMGLRTTLDSVATTSYPNSHKLIVIICDGIIKGSGNDLSTPDICLSMMKDFFIPPEEVEAYSYVSVVEGAKRHNMAKVYSGFYRYDDETVANTYQQRVPVITIVKCGTPAEANDAKPGNRGKRDSQVILMSFLERIMFDERMTELDFEIFNGIRSVTGIAPDYYETMLMVDADTKVFPDSLTHMVAEMVKDPEIMGLCGETKIANKMESWVTMIQVFEYFISHHQAKAFESVFSGVTCLPGCFSMYRIKSPKGREGYWVPILCNPDIVERYSEHHVETLHQKNLLLLGEDRYLSSLMLRTFPKRKMVFVPKAACKTIAPSSFWVLLSQRRRWINSTIHNLMELVLVRDLCGVFIISMQFVVFIDLVSTLVLPAAIAFTLYIIIISIVRKPTPILSLVLLGLILGLPGLLIVVTASRPSYILWMIVYLLALPIWNFVLPMYAYWKFDDFSWGDTRKIEGGDTGHDDGKGEFDSTQIVMKRWREFQRDRARKSMPLNSRSDHFAYYG